LKQLRIELEWLPLFHRALVVSRTVMVQPLIALEVDKAGRPNWVLGPGAASAAVPHGPLPSGLVGGGFGFASVELRKPGMVDGKIRYVDRRSGRTERLDHIDARLSLRSLASPLAVKGSMVWRGERVTLAVDIDRPHAFLEGAEAQVSVELAAAPIVVTFS